MIKHIVAFVKTVNGQQAIGINGKLPWHLPEDLQHFKQQTMGKAIYMGSNTFRSIVEYSKGGKVLQGREIYVISGTVTNADALRRQYGVSENVHYWTKSILDAEIETKPNKEFLIVGGAKLYEAYPPDVVIATEVFTKVEEADAFYPFELNKQFIIVNGSIGHSYSAKLNYSIGTYRRIPDKK